jgi:cellulose synthase/poly-beta-1,6-N-acetylglucosamine synthase-like glycosyltransferase
VRAMSETRWSGTPSTAHEPRSPTVSLVVCCYTFDRLEDSLAAVRSGFEQSIRPREVIVSVDHNADLAETLRERLPVEAVVLLNDGVRGLSETRNVAIARATGEIVAFLDDDAVADPRWLERLLEVFRDPRVVAVGGRSAAAWDRGEAPPWFPREYDFIIGCTDHKELVVKPGGEIRSVTGSNMAFRRAVFEALGGWRQDLGRGQVKTGGEEAELCLRIKSAMPGALILYVPSAVVRHKVNDQRATLKYVFTYCFNEGIVRAMLRTIASQFTGAPLEGERMYLRGLLLRSIPERLKRPYRPAAAAQLCVIVLNTLLVALGYARGRLIFR